MIGWQGRILAALHLSSYYGDDFIPSCCICTSDRSFKTRFGFSQCPRDPRQMSWKLCYSQAVIAIVLENPPHKDIALNRGVVTKCLRSVSLCIYILVPNYIYDTPLGHFCGCNRCKTITLWTAARSRSTRSGPFHLAEKSELGKGSALTFCLSTKTLENLKLIE